MLVVLPSRGIGERKRYPLWQRVNQQFIYLEVKDHVLWSGPVQRTSPRLCGISLRWSCIRFVSFRGGPVENQQGTRRVRVKDPIESTHGAGIPVFGRRLCGRVHFDPPICGFGMSSTSSPAALTLTSPPSSPNTYRFSSSPAPPSPEPATSLLPAIELDEPPLDPFSGTSKSIRPPPLYEKANRVRARSPGDGSPPGPRKRARHAFNVEGRVSASTSVQISAVATTKRYSEEESLWNEVISRVIDTADPVVDLSYVPPVPSSQIGCPDLIFVQLK